MSFCKETTSEEAIGIISEYSESSYKMYCMLMLKAYNTYPSEIKRENYFDSAQKVKEILLALKNLELDFLEDFFENTKMEFLSDKFSSFDEFQSDYFERKD